MNEDYLDMLSVLLNAGARFLVVGAHALSVHGVPRTTGDIDIWIERTERNAERVWAALNEFGAPIDAIQLKREDLLASGQVVQIGVAPRRIDLLTSITGVEFEAAWNKRVVHSVPPLDVPFIGRDDLIRNKKATGRLQDLADVESLESN